MLEEYLVQTCQLITATRNEYGDYIEGVTTTLDCRFREISTINRSSHVELADADAMIWFAPDTEIAIGNIILFDGVHYQIERLTNARRLGESETQFIKCDLKITNIGFS